MKLGKRICRHKNSGRGSVDPLLGRTYHKLELTGFDVDERNPSRFGQTLDNTNIRFLYKHGENPHVRENACSIPFSVDGLNNDKRQIIVADNICRLSQIKPIQILGQDYILCRYLEPT